MNDYTTIRVRRSTAELIDRLCSLMTTRLKEERGISANVSKDAAIEVAAASYISTGTRADTKDQAHDDANED